MPPGRVAPPYSRACVGYGQGNGGGAGESQEAGRIMGLLLCCCHSVVLASDYVQAAAVKTVHTVHHWLSEGPGFRCMCQHRTHSKLVRPQLQRTRQPVVCPYAGERESWQAGRHTPNTGISSKATLPSASRDKSHTHNQQCEKNEVGQGHINRLKDDRWNSRVTAWRP